MDTQDIVAIASIVAVVAMLVHGRIANDLVMAGGLGLLVMTGALTPSEAFAGLASSSILTIALLLVVAQGVIETGLVQWIGPVLLGRSRTAAIAQLRMMVPVAAISAFINNTPLVAMCVPIVQDFAQRMRIAPSRLFIPLAYAATLGGVCSLVGTSTNLVVNEMWMQGGNPSFRLFDLAPIGVPVAAAGIVYLVLVGRWLLLTASGRPSRRPTRAATRSR